MQKWIIGGLAAVMLVAGAGAQATCSFTYTFASGTNAVASQVNQDLNDIVNCALQASGGTLSNGTLSGTTALPGSGAITSTGGLGVGIANPAIVGDGIDVRRPRDHLLELRQWQRRRHIAAAQLFHRQDLDVHATRLRELQS